MEDFVLTKVAPDGEWTNINVSEMARILQDANPSSEIISTGKAVNQETGVVAADTSRKKMKKK